MLISPHLSWLKTSILTFTLLVLCTGVWASSVQKINNKAEFDTAIRQGKYVLLKFYASWCGPCRAMAPIIAEVAKEQAGKILVYEIEVGKDPSKMTKSNENDYKQIKALAKSLEVKYIPTLFIYKNGKLIEKSKRNSGTKDEIDNWLNENLKPNS